jgi:hypothetical protein
VATLGDFYEMDVRIKIVEGRQIRSADVVGRIHAQ